MSTDLCVLVLTFFVVLINVIKGCPFVFLGKYVLGTVNKSKEEAPFNNVTIAIKSLKFPKVSASTPANGGPKISATGITLLTIAASSMLKPKERICKVR